MATSLIPEAAGGVLYLHSVSRPREGMGWHVPLHSRTDILLHGAEQFRSYAFWLGAEGDPA